MRISIYRALSAQAMPSWWAQKSWVGLSGVGSYHSLFQRLVECKCPCPPQNKNLCFWAWNSVFYHTCAHIKLWEAYEGGTLADPQMAQGGLFLRWRRDLKVLRREKQGRLKREGQKARRKGTGRKRGRGRNLKSNVIKSYALQGANLGISWGSSSPPFLSNSVCRLI